MSGHSGSKYHICTTCLVPIFPIKPTKQSVKLFCGNDCEEKYRRSFGDELMTKKIPKCEKCVEHKDFEVPFGNNTFHIKRICVKCHRGGFINRNFIGKFLDKSYVEISKMRIRESRELIPKEIKTTIRIQKKCTEKRFGESFYSSRPWLELRYLTLMKKGAVCSLCGSTKKPLHVDHIQPRSIFPALSLDPSNLQVLCASCNIGKSNFTAEQLEDIQFHG